MARYRDIAEIGRAKMGGAFAHTMPPIMQERRDYGVTAGAAVVIVNNFPLYAANMDKVIWRETQRMGRAVIKDISGGGPHAAPIDTGNLRQSYHMQENQSDMSIIIENDPAIAHYAPFVELGSPTIYHPHLRPSVIHHFGAFVNSVTNVFYTIHDEHGVPFSF